MPEEESLEASSENRHRRHVSLKGWHVLKKLVPETFKRSWPLKPHDFGPIISASLWYLFLVQVTWACITPIKLYKDWLVVFLHNIVKFALHIIFRCKSQPPFEMWGVVYLLLLTAMALVIHLVNMWPRSVIAQSRLATCCVIDAFCTGWPIELQLGLK